VHQWVHWHECRKRASGSVGVMVWVQGQHQRGQLHQSSSACQEPMSVCWTYRSVGCFINTIFVVYSTDYSLICNKGWGNKTT
jgi:hypothetical protein